MCVRTRGYWAAVNIEIDAEGGSLGDEESNFALESGIEDSAAESKQVLVRLHMRISGSSKEVDSHTMGLQEQITDKFTVQAARGASDGGHKRDRAVVITCRVAPFIFLMIAILISRSQMLPLRRFGQGRCCCHSVHVR